MFPFISSVPFSNAKNNSVSEYAIHYTYIEDSLILSLCQRWHEIAHNVFSNNIKAPFFSMELLMNDHIQKSFLRRLPQPIHRHFIGFMQNNLSWCSLERFHNANHSWNLNMQIFNNKDVAPINEQLGLKGIFLTRCMIASKLQRTLRSDIIGLLTLPSSNRVHLAQKLLPLSSKDGKTISLLE